MFVSQPPGLGGPESPYEGAAYNPPDYLQVLNQLAEDIENREQQLGVLETLLARLIEEGQIELPSMPMDVPLLYHAHCHQKALVGSADAMTLLRATLGGAATEIDSGCCGMAGSFGHEVEHYDIARQIGEQRLFPAVRNRGDARIAVSGFSCRTQIEHHTGVPVRHIIEYLVDGLGDQM